MEETMTNLFQYKVKEEPIEVKEEPVGKLKQESDEECMMPSYATSEKPMLECKEEIKTEDEFLGDTKLCAELWTPIDQVPTIPNEMEEKKGIVEWVGKRTECEAPTCDVVHGLKSDVGLNIVKELNLCLKCHKSFTTKKTLRRHILFVHEKVKLFKCASCNYECNRKEYLAFHIKSVHEKLKPVVYINRDHECNRNFQKFGELNKTVYDTKSAIKFFQEKGVIPTTKKCPQNHEMYLHNGMALIRKQGNWICNRMPCSTSIGLRQDTWLENSKLPLDTIIKFIYAWCFEFATPEFCSRQLKMPNKSVTDWTNFLREVCAGSLLKNPTKIGGPGMTVEIDESYFVKKKRCVGKVYPLQWVFGGVCRETKQCFVYAVEDRTPETLLKVIEKTIEPGTTIISDIWISGIHRIPNMNFKHYPTNHNVNLADPISASLTQDIDSIWLKSKDRNCSTTNKLVDSSNLCEFLWRLRNKPNNLFEQIFTDIVAFWPPK